MRPNQRFESTRASALAHLLRVRVSWSGGDCYLNHDFSKAGMEVASLSSAVCNHRTSSFVNEPCSPPLNRVGNHISMRHAVVQFWCNSSDTAWK